MRLGLQQSRCGYDQPDWLDVAEPFKVSGEFGIAWHLNICSWFLVGGIGFQPVMRCHALTDRLEAYPTLYPVTGQR